MNPADRLCDFCNESKALLYCRADSAKLCINCDREVHSTNQLFKKHGRCLLCDSCNSSPASIFCHSESLVLCQNCDWESHKNVRSIHDRRPLEGFTGCPSVTELLNFLGFENFEKKSRIFYDEEEVDNDDDEGWLDLLVWETPSVVSLDDLIVPNDSGHSFQAIGVPPLPKNRNVACGKYKEEILCQLREMAKTDNCCGCLEDVDPHVLFKAQDPGEFQLENGSPDRENILDPLAVPSYETNAHEWCDYSDVIPRQGFASPLLGNFIQMNQLVTNNDPDIGNSSGIATGCQEIQSQAPVDSEKLPKAVVAREFNSQERDSAISRYKEKRKSRRYDKQIRYESRKVRAQSRTRIKGRFAKMDC